MLTTKSEKGNVTFRFNNEVLGRLRDESDQKRISLNTLAGQIFQTHVEYHMYAAKAGMVSFPKSLLVRIMSRLTEREVDALSEHIAKNDIKDLTRLMKNEYSIPAFLNMFESWLRVSGFVYRRDISESVQTFVIQHDMGKRWSTYFEKLIEYVFEDLNEDKPEFDISDNLLSFRIR